MSELVRSEVTDRVALLTLARPAVLNAINLPMARDLTDALLAVGSEIRAVILTGAGRAFSACLCIGEAAADR